MKEKLKEFFENLAGKLKARWEGLDKNGKILLAALVAIILLIGFFKMLPERQKKLPVRPEVIVPVQVIEAAAQDRADLIILSGLVLADIDATLAAEKSGRVVELLADRGEAVTNGQVLLRLDDRTARIAFEDAARNLERFEKLSGTGAVSQKDLDDIRKVHDLAETALSDCTVKSPADGIVNERYVEEGEYVMPGTPVFDVIAIDPVRITVDIPERNVSSLTAGEPVPFEVLSLPGEKFTGTVAYISSKASTDNNAFRIELTVANPDQILRPGMIASVQHQRGIRKNAITLPLSAIIPQKGDNVVFLVRDGRAVRQMVRIDSILETEAMLLSGVEPGDLVVTRGNRMLTDGTAVSIQD